MPSTVEARLNKLEGLVRSLISRVGELSAAAVTSVFGRTGAVTATDGDYSQSLITGLKTSDSPQFTALNLGHASDTTIARASAGVITVEGDTVVTLGDGGTFTAAIEATDHGTASTDQVVNVCYGTGAAPTASTTTEGTIYLTYTA